MRYALDDCVLIMCIVVYRYHVITSHCPPSLLLLFLGLMVSRDLEEGNWSSPCAVACCGMGWGVQVGPSQGEVQRELLCSFPSEERLLPCQREIHFGGHLVQVGGELTDALLVLRDEDQLAACCAGARLGLGGNLGLAVGIAGRHADASVLVSDKTLYLTTKIFVKIGTRFCVTGPHPISYELICYTTLPTCDPP